VQIVAKWKKLNNDQYWEQALVLGWAIEILQALFLVADDIMDGSITRRGQPCWYKQEDVKMDAINDTLILESFLFFLLNEHFANHPNFVPIVQLYQSVSLQTQLGQMLDLLSQPQGRKGPEILNQFSLEVYERIVCYKTAIYTFYLPLAAGLLVTNVVGSDSEELKVCRELSIDLGTKFQIEDDYLDCYGAPEVIGKIGTDIKDHKCSWLVVQALKRVNAAQKKMLEENYGHEEKECEDRVKALYRELKLEAVYEKQEDDSYAAIEAKVAKYANKLPGDLFLPILKKIHKRIK
jgi:farnesyl diphosphate synthase